MNSKNIPQPVKNLRAIWNSKKAEMQFTQVEAAKKLGWTQSAISHYLNDITTLGPSAVIKLANFLGVDPREIDPDVIEFLPNVRTHVVAYDADDLTQKINQKHHYKVPPSAFWVRIKRIPLPNAVNYALDGQALICPVKDASSPKVFLVRLKGQKRGALYHKSQLPPEKEITKKYAVLEFVF